LRRRRAGECRLTTKRKIALPVKLNSLAHSGSASESRLRRTSKKHQGPNREETNLCEFLSRGEKLVQLLVNVQAQPMHSPVEFGFGKLGPQLDGFFIKLKA